LQDFAWWSGLPAKEASKGLELVKQEFERAQVNGSTYWLSSGLTFPRIEKDGAYLLPTYDEFIISYSDRSAAISEQLEEHMKQISDRGVFRPIIVVEGQVVGIWKRNLKNNTLQIEIQSFISLKQSTKERIVDAASRYGSFFGIPIEIM
jgi:hypothetical protein